MANQVLYTKIIIRNDSAANWTAKNPVLGKGEIGIDMSVTKFKIGDGVTAWNDLAYYDGSLETAISDLEARVDALEAKHDPAVFTASVESGADKLAALNAAVTASGKTLGTGDIGIVTETITGAYKQYTGYVYDGTQWQAMDGNYDAENVYFKKDLVITANIGVQTIDSTGSKTLATTGKNVKEVFDMIVAQEKNPTTTQPSASVTLTSAGAKEVGTAFTPSYSATLNAGSYTYGPATGITASSWAITDTAGNSATTASGSFAQFTVEETTSYKITAVATYAAGTIPVTNLGNNYAAGQIKAGTKSATSGTVTGYRGWFCGYYNGTQAIDDPTAITSAQIRAFGVRNGSFVTSMSTNQMKQMFFAAPAGKVSSVKVANSVNGAPQTVSKTTVSVQGANGYTAIDYDVFYVSNAVAESGASTFTITTTKA